MKITKIRTVALRTARKAVLTAVVVTEIAALTLAPANALIFGGGGVSAGQIMRQVEETYHIDPDAVRNFSEGFNVAQNKDTAPEVTIIFSPQDPKPGQKITARAYTQYFTNTTDSLYFTWYLKRRRCEEGRGLVEVNKTFDRAEESGLSGNCDYDGENGYDINDQKIEAARIIAAGGFDAQRATEAGDDDGDRDGYVAYPGGDNKRSAIEEFQPYYYYLHDFNSGTSYEVVDEIAAEEIFPECTGDRTPVCVMNEELACASRQIMDAVAKNMGGEATAAATGAAGGDGADTGGGGGGGATAEAAIEIPPTIMLNTTDNQAYYSFNICKVSGAPTCQALVAQQNVAEAGGDPGAQNPGVEGGGTPLCAAGAVPVCVDKAALRYTNAELAERAAENNAMKNDEPWAYAASAAEEPYEEEESHPVEIPVEGKFTNFQCTDYDIQSLVTFFPPPTAPIVDPEEALETEIVAQGAELEAIRRVFVYHDYYSCEAELDGVAYYGLESDGKAIPMERIEECNPQEITAETIPHNIHLFPYNEGRAQVGRADGEFPAAEEAFYRTDPNDKDTADNRIDDEQSVVGMGQDSFTWIYMPGDEVGVIVEGTTMTPTKHPDSSNMIMFATTNNACDYAGMVNHSVVTATGSYVTQIRGYNVEIPAISFDNGNEFASEPDDGQPGAVGAQAFENALNLCIQNTADRDARPRAYVDPAQGGAAKKLEIDLSYTPNNPIADDSQTTTAAVGAMDKGASYINSADVVSVSSMIANATYKANRLKYSWTVYRSRNGDADPDPENWEPIAGRVADGDYIDRGEGPAPLTDLSPLEGNDLADIWFRLDAPGLVPDDRDFSYIKVRVNVEEDFDLLAEDLHEYDISRGRADIVIRVSRAANEMRAYVMENQDQAVNGAAGPEICHETPQQLVNCPVGRNQLVRVFMDEKGEDRKAEYKNFRWRLNGQTLDRPAALDNCAGDAATTQEDACNYFVASGPTGTEYEVTVSAVNVASAEGASGRAVELTRKFTVVDPYVAFCSSENVADDGTADTPGCQGLTRKETGTYASDTGTETRYADNVFLAETGSSPTVAGSARPTAVAGMTTVDWFVSGVHAGTGTTDLVVDGSTTKPGEAIIVLGRAVYEQPQEIRQLLREIWHMTDNDLQPVRFDNDMRIEFDDNIAPVAMTAPQLFLASLGLNLPGTVLFLFRVFLSVGVVVSLLAIAWRTLPESGIRRI